MSKLTQDEINALKALAQLAPTIVSTLGQSAALPVKQEKKGRGRPKKVVTQPNEAIKPKPVKLTNTQKTVDEDGESKPRRGQNTTRQKGQACRREPVATNIVRPNLFDQMDIAKQKNVEPDDKKWDKKWKKQKIKERDPSVRTTIVSIDCSKCGKEFDVSPNEIKKDYDGNIEYICNECLLEKR